MPSAEDLFPNVLTVDELCDLVTDDILKAKIRAAADKADALIGR